MHKERRPARASRPLGWALQPVPLDFPQVQPRRLLRISFRFRLFFISPCSKSHHDMLRQCSRWETGDALERRGESQRGFRQQRGLNDPLCLTLLRLSLQTCWTREIRVQMSVGVPRREQWVSTVRRYTSVSERRVSTTSAILSGSMYQITLVVDASWTKK